MKVSALRQIQPSSLPTSIEGLVALYDCYEAAIEAMMEIYDRPKSNAARDNISDGMAALGAKADLVVERLKKITPLNDHEIQIKALVFVRDCFRCGGSLLDAAASLTAAHADERIPS